MHTTQNTKQANDYNSLTKTKINGIKRSFKN